MPNVFGSLGTVWAEMGLDYRKLDEGVQGAISRLSWLDRETQRITMQIGQQFQKLGAAMALAFTTPLALMGRQIVSTFAQFEQSLANAAAVSGATGEQLRKMEEAAREAGRTSVFSASQAADAMYYLASAGYTAEQQMAALKGILDLAAATQSDLAFAASTVTSAISSFGLQASDASRVANVFAAAIVSSQAELDKLADSMRYIGPVAGAFGLQIEEITAALGLLYNAGLRGEQAGTTLRYALSQLANPAGQAAEVLKELGLSADQVNPQLHSLADIIATLEQAGIDGAQAMRLFGTEAGPGMIALLSQGSQVLRDYTAQITGTNRASEVAEQQVNTLQGSLRLLHSAWEELSIALSRSVYPVLRQIVDVLRNVISWFAELPGSVQRFIVVAGALTAALGPLAAAFGLFLSSLSALAGPLGIAAAVAALGGLTAAFIGARREADPTAESAVELARKNKDLADQVLTLVRRFEELKGKPKRTQEEEEELQRVVEALNKLLPDHVKGFRDLRDTLSDPVGIDGIRKWAEGLLQLGQAAVISEAARAIARLNDELRQQKDLQEQINDLKSRYGDKIEQVQLFQDRAARAALALAKAEAEYQKSGVLNLDEVARVIREQFPDAQVRNLREARQLVENLQSMANNAANAYGAVMQRVAGLEARLKELGEAIKRDQWLVQQFERAAQGKPIELPAPTERRSEPARRPEPVARTATKTSEQVDEDLQELEAIMERHRQRLDVLRVTGQDIFGRGADLRQALAEFSNILFEWANATSRSAAARAAAARAWESVTRELVAATGAEAEALGANARTHAASLQDAIRIQRQMIEVTRATGGDWRRMAQEYLQWLEAIVADERRTLDERLAAARAMEDAKRLLAENVPVVDVQKALKEAAQASQAITREFWEGIREGLRRRGATPAEVAQAIADILNSGIPMAEDLRQELEREYDALLPQVTSWAAGLAKAESEAYIRAGREYLDSLPEQANPWFPDPQATARAVEAADEAGDAVTREFWRSLRDGMRARGASAWEISQALADLLESGRPMSRQLRAELEQEYDALVRESTAGILAAADEFTERRGKVYRITMRAGLDEIKAAGEQHQRALSAWGQRYAWLAQYLIDKEAESVRKRLELERQWAEETKRIWADVLRGFAGPLARPIEVVIRAWRETGAGERLQAPWRAFADQAQAFGRALDAVLLHIPSRLAGLLGSAFRSLADFAQRAFARAGEWLQPALASLGASLGSLFGPLGGVLSALAGPIGAFLGVLLEQAPQAQTLMQALQQVVAQLATALGAILTPLVPVVQVLGQVLQPVIQALMPLMYMLGQALAYVGQIVLTLLQPAFAVLAAILQVLTPIFQVLNPILYAFAVIVTTIWNVIARVWNSAVRFVKNLPLIGWLFSWLPELQEVQAPQQPATTPQQAQQQAQEGARQGASNAGTQVVNFTGETRNLFVEMLRPLGNLDRLAGYFDNELQRLDRLVAIADQIADSMGSTALAQAMQDFAAQVAAMNAALSAAVTSAMQAAMVQSGIAQMAQAIEVTGQATFQIQQASIQIESANFYGNRISFSLLPDGQLIGRMLGRELQAALRGMGA